MVKTFSSKVDSSFYVLLGMNAIISIIIPLVVAKSILGALVISILFVFLFKLLHSIKYNVDQNNSLIHISGFIFYNYTVHINSITSISKNKSMTSAQAASFDRISIDTKHKSHIISPQNQDEFIQLLKQINPSIEVTV